MSDQVKYTQKLQGAKILITGGSAGKSHSIPFHSPSPNTSHDPKRKTTDMSSLLFFFPPQKLGIGYGVAEACLENGCNVTISSSNDTRVQQAVAKLSAAYPSAAAQNRIRGFACNFGEEKTLEAEVKRLLELVGKGIDHVVHTAGDGLATMKLEGIEMEGVKKAGESFFLFFFFFCFPLCFSLFRVRNRMHTRYANNFLISRHGPLLRAPLPRQTRPQIHEPRPRIQHHHHDRFRVRTTSSRLDRRQLLRDRSARNGAGHGTRFETLANQSRVSGSGGYGIVEGYARGCETGNVCGDGEENPRGQGWAGRGCCRELFVFDEGSECFGGYG